MRLARSIEAILEREFVVRRDSASPKPTVPQAKELAAAMALRVAVFARGGIERRSGDLATIMAEVEPGDVDGVRIGNFQSLSKSSRGFPIIDVRLGQIPGAAPSEQGGVRIRVNGDNRQWVGGGYDELSLELSRRVPGWSVVTTWWFAILVNLAIVWGIYGLVVAFAHLDARSVINLLSIPAIFSLIGFTWVMPILVKVFPSFELTPPGGQ